MCFGKPLVFSNHFIYRIIQFPITFCLLFDVLRFSRNFFARLEGQFVLDSHMCLFCSPTPLTNSFSPRESSILFNTSSLRCDAHEARQKVVIWKDSREEVDKAHNANTP